MDKIDVTSTQIEMSQKGPIFLKFIDEIENFSNQVSETVLHSIYAHRNDKTTFYLINICPQIAEMDKIDVTSMLTKMGQKGPIFFKFIDEIQNFFLWSLGIQGIQTPFFPNKLIQNIMFRTF